MADNLMEKIVSLAGWRAAHLYFVKLVAGEPRLFAVAKFY
jgi:hypothetical protein